MFIGVAPWGRGKPPVSAWAGNQRQRSYTKLNLNFMKNSSIMAFVMKTTGSIDRMHKARRGPRADGEATRARILHAAGELFAASGYAETTSKAVAARAGVDLASINYHFGNRDGLYQAVLIEAHSRWVDFADLQQLAHSALPAQEKLKALLQQLVHTAVDDAEDWRLAVLAAEFLAPSSHIQVLTHSEAPMKVSLILDILGEITGVPAKEPALSRCMLSIIAPCLMLLLVNRRGMPGFMQTLRKMSNTTLVDHLYQFTSAGLEAIGREYAARAGQSPAALRQPKPARATHARGATLKRGKT
ncbi:MAG: TetR/AcrR family transcriptional regulator [Pseudoxanthomonas sp.]